MQVEDTNEVEEAKSNFYQLYEEAKKQSEAEDEPEATTVQQEAEVARSRREGEAEPVEAVTEKAAEDSAAEETEQPEAALKQASGNYFYFNQMLPNQMKAAPLDSPKLVYHPYYGYIPVAPKKEEAMDADAKKETPAKMAYVFDPYYGYIPYTPKNEAEMNNKKLEQQKFEFNPYFGYIPVAEKKETMKVEGEQFVYHPYYGFTSVSKLKAMGQEMNENQRYTFDPMYGFIPVAKKAEEEKMEAVEAGEATAEAMVAAEASVEAAEMVKAAEEVEEIVAEEMKEEMKEEADAKKFYFHPYYGFIPVAKLTDEKMRKGVNMDMKYVLHPYFGFIPESQMIGQKKQLMPYNPFGYKFVPYQPKKYYYMYNTIGDKMNAMTAKAAEAVEAVEAEPMVEAEAVENRKKRSPVYVVPQVYQGPKL